jgi:hypothetical protein
LQFCGARRFPGEANSTGLSASCTVDNLIAVTPYPTSAFLSDNQGLLQKSGAHHHDPRWH